MPPPRALPLDASARADATKARTPRQPERHQARQHNQPGVYVSASLPRSSSSTTACGRSFLDDSLSAPHSWEGVRSRQPSWARELGEGRAWRARRCGRTPRRDGASCCGASSGRTARGRTTPRAAPRSYAHRPCRRRTTSMSTTRCPPTQVHPPPHAHCRGSPTVFSLSSSVRLGRQPRRRWCTTRLEELRWMQSHCWMSCAGRTARRCWIRVDAEELRRRRECMEQVLERPRAAEDHP
jgi:hypothetical protein